MNNLKLLLFSLIALTFLTYSNTLPNQLFYDDEELIYKNLYVQNLRFLPKYFTENMIAGAGKISNMYRPILLLSFALDYLFWQGKAFGFHLTNILLHTANGLLIFFLIKKLFQRKSLAFFTALLFLIHPVQTEAIAYASGRTDPLFTFFSFVSIFSFLFFLEKKRVFGYFLSLFFFFLALLSKETAIVFPFLLGLIFLLKKKEEKKNFFSLFFLLLPFFFFTFIYLFLRLTFLNFANTLNFYSEKNLYSQNFWVRIFTFSLVFFEYLFLLLLPKELIFARDVPLITSFWSLPVLTFLLFLTFSLFFSFLKWKENPLYLFSLLWFLFGLLPVSGLIPINSIFAEHYLYFPSLGFFLFLTSLGQVLWKNVSSHSRIFLFLFFFSVLFLFFWQTVHRNLDWRDPLTFYTKSLSQSPWHVPLRHNLAMTYAELGKYELAIQEYQKIISLADVYPQTHHNLANLYQTLGKYQEAEEEYQKALQMDPRFRFSFEALKNLYRKTGQEEKLKKLLEEEKKNAN